MFVNEWSWVKSWPLQLFLRMYPVSFEYIKKKLHSDFKMIALALTRKGTAYVKMTKCSKDYEPAIEAFQKALT